MLDFIVMFAQKQMTLRLSVQWTVLLFQVPPDRQNHKQNLQMI